VNALVKTIIDSIPKTPHMASVQTNPAELNCSNKLVTSSDLFAEFALALT
jgi:hypothetical protein